MSNSAKQTADSVYQDGYLLELLQMEHFKLELLAMELGVSVAAVSERVQRLQKSGVIARSVVVLDREKIGITHEDLVLLKLRQPKATSEAELVAIVESMPEVYLAQAVDDCEFDVLLHLATAGQRHQEETLFRIVQSECVESHRNVSKGRRTLKEHVLPTYISVELST